MSEAVALEWSRRAGGAEAVAKMQAGQTARAMPARNLSTLGRLLQSIVY